MVTRKILPGVIASSLMLPAIPSWSQLEEVIVTARKREESVLNVPVAVTAFSGQQLEQFGTDDMYTLTERVPGFVMGTQVASIGPTPSLRGIGTGTLNPTIDQSVSLNIDGLGFSQALAFSSGMFDMASMEVLRGPQSLFYGKNSTAGVISINTRDPADEFEAEVGVGYEADAEEWQISGILSGPITDTFGVRLAVQQTSMDGYFDNNGVSDGISSLAPSTPKIPESEELTVRGTAVWEPTSAFTAKLKATYNTVDIPGYGGNGQLSSCPDGLDTNFTAPPLDPGIVGALGYYYGTTDVRWWPENEDCKLDDKVAIVSMDPSNPLYTGIRNGGVPFFDLEQYYGSLLLDWEISEDLTLSSVTGYANSEHNVMINGLNTGLAGPIIVADTNFSREDFTQELRLTSNYDGAWNYMIGAYYQDGEMVNRTGLYFFGPRDKGKLPIDIETQAIFGQLLWRIVPDVELAAGARYTDETRKFKPVNLATGEPFPIETYFTDELQTDDVSPEFSVTWTPTETLTFFGGYRKAFKSGSWDTVSNPRGFDLSFDDEDVEGYEGGMKTLMLDSTIALNVSGYFYEYDNLQVGANESTPDGFLIRTLNAASATIWGIDMDVAWAVPSIDGLELFAVANYNNAEYDKFDNALCWGGQTSAEGCDQDFDEVTGLYQAQDLSGGDLLRAPEFGATFGFTYEKSFGDTILTLGSSTLWSDEYAANTLLRDDFYQDSYFKTSASIGLRAADGAWEVNLIGKNLNDEITAGNCTNFNGQYGNVPGTIITGSPTGERGIGGVDEAVCIAERGRELWLKVTIRPSVRF
ncbi:TonB-dependent receptor [Haliea sp. E17]|uniref:TonB-dependent receptor n=1 Tax=Haliea sp. E17 TaxID=3401576 RepID=UPI003AADC4F0